MSRRFVAHGARPLAERFEEKYEVDESSGCWNWVAANNGKGYGLIRGAGHNGGVLYAHRVSYELHVGEIPAGLTIDHLCRNRGCVNPDHLEPVTIRENLLRGDTITARNASRTHCPQGHPYDEENTWIEKTGARHCRACHRERDRSRRSA